MSMNPVPSAHYRQIHRRKSVQTWTFLILLALLAAFCLYKTDFSPVTLATGVHDISWMIFDNFLPPKASVTGSILKPALDTVCMSVVAALAASVVAGFLAFQAAKTTTAHPTLRYLTRGFASLLRNLPMLIWALILTFAYGLGNIVGLVALFIGSLGLLTRAYAECIEEVNAEKLEAVRAAGASYWQVLIQGVFPQVLPGFVAWTLYQIELNIRGSAVVGMVGGGGIGYYIQNEIALFQFKSATMAVILVIVMIVVTEFLTREIRRRIL